MPCESLSKYYSLPNGKCYNAEYGNKLCRSGWTQDFVVQHDEYIPPDVVEEVPIQEYTIAYVNNCVTGATDKYMCKMSTGKCLTTDEIIAQLE